MKYKCIIGCYRLNQNRKSCVIEETKNDISFKPRNCVMDGSEVGWKELKPEKKKQR